MFIRPEDEDLKNHVPNFTVIHVPGMKANPATDSTRSSTFICLHMTKGIAIIGGTFYAVRSEPFFSRLHIPFFSAAHPWSSLFHRHVLRRAG